MQFPVNVVIYNPCNLCNQMPYTCQRLAVITGITWSMANVDQCQPMPIKIIALYPKCLSMLIIASQCRSIPINLALIGIDQHWSELINIEINARILIGIDRHWALIKGVLKIERGIRNCYKSKCKSFPLRHSVRDISKSWSGLLT